VKRIIITGKRHSGKTTLALALVRALERSGRSVAGILAPGYWKDGLRDGFDLVNLATGRVVPLARRRKENTDKASCPIPLETGPEETGPEETGPARVGETVAGGSGEGLKAEETTLPRKTDPEGFQEHRKTRVPGRAMERSTPFVFSAPGMAEGNAALSPDSCRGAWMVLVDEVGPLELGGKGWAPLLAPLLELGVPVQVWVVREDAVDQVKAAWPVDGTRVVDAAAPDCLETLLALCLT
jgi:nucleoside-triphosphatase THEP1